MVVDFDKWRELKARIMREMPEITETWLQTEIIHAELYLED